MVLRQINNDWNEHRERLVLVSLKDVEEVVVLKEAHRSVSDLQVDATDALEEAACQANNQNRMYSP